MLAHALPILIRIGIQKLLKDRLRVIGGGTVMGKLLWRTFDEFQFHTRVAASSLYVALIYTYYICRYLNAPVKHKTHVLLVVVDWQ